MSRETVLHAQEQFLSTQFITPNALSKFDFDTYTAALIDQLNKTTVAEFYADNHFISSIIDQYEYTSALRTNFYTISIPGSSSYTNFPTVYPTQANLDQSSFISNGTCSCDVTSNCAYPAGIYNHSMSIVPNEIFLPDASRLFAVTGFKIGCVPQNALLQSTLECLYNQSCLNMFVALTAAITTVAPLNMSSSSRFLLTTTIELMFKNLMLESWEGFTNFSESFRTCAPKACQVRNLVTKIYLQATTLNMFKAIFANVQVGIYSTRLYIILLMTGVFVLIIYTSSETRSQQIIIRNPSSQQFQQLNSKYPSILSCPCTHTSIQRSTFMYNNVSFHPFCTSAFVRDPVWLQYWTMTFFNGTVDGSPPFDWPDFRKTGLKYISCRAILLCTTAESNGVQCS
ncbi:unnamed protein product [Rotaria magnacalcarata]